MNSINAYIISSIKKETPVDDIFKTITFIIIIRTFFEMLLERSHSFKFHQDFYLNIVSYMHMYLFWLSIFFTVGILMAIFLKLRYIEALRFNLLFFPLILIPPFFDFIFTGGEGGQLLYSFEIDTFFYNYINCFNPFAEIDAVTRGVRIEILIMFLGSFYVSYFVFKKGLLRSIFLSISIYTTILLFGYLPALYKISGIDFYNLTGKAVSGITKSQKFLYMYLFPSVLIPSAIIYLLSRENKENLKSAISFLYPGRLSFYLLLLISGFIFVSQKSNIYPAVLNHEDFMKFVSAAISITFLFFYAKIINDIYDLEIDKISNRYRPLAKNTLLVKSASEIKNIMLPLSFVFALASEISFIFYWFFIWAGAYIYSVPPFRIRRYYPMGHFVLSFIAVSVFLAGGALIKSYDVYNVLQPEELLLWIFLAFFFFSHIKDFKDIEGDKKGGVYNILNYVKFPRAMGILFVSGFTLSMYFVMKILVIVNTIALIGTAIFFAASLFYILTVKDIKRLDRLLLFGLLFLFFAGSIWIYKISS